jgi:hypothetical protein
MLPLFFLFSVLLVFISKRLIPWRSSFLADWRCLVANKFREFYGTHPKFYRVLTRARKRSIFRNKLIQSSFFNIHFNIILPSMLKSARWCLPFKILITWNRSLIEKLIADCSASRLM